MLPTKEIYCALSKPSTKIIFKKYISSLSFALTLTLSPCFSKTLNWLKKIMTKIGNTTAATDESLLFLLFFSRAHFIFILPTVLCFSISWIRHFQMFGRKSEKKNNINFKSMDVFIDGHIKCLIPFFSRFEKNAKWVTYFSFFPYIFFKTLRLFVVVLCFFFSSLLHSEIHLLRK